MNLDLAGKVFIVTGGTSGLGLATARTLLDEGARVLVTGRTEATFERMLTSLDVPSDRIAFGAGDNADPDLPRRLAETALQRWGRLDGLLVSVGGLPTGQVLSMDDDLWRTSFETVFLGTVRLVRELSAVMANGGAIALVLAVSAKEVAPTVPLSNGLRPGLAMLVKNFAIELGPRGIRINALLPNLFGTERMQRFLQGADVPVSQIALGRIGDPAEFGRMATVLLSGAASYVTGAAIPIDGGQLRSL